MDSQIAALVEELKTAKTQADLHLNLERWKNILDFDWYLFALSRSESMQVSEHIILTNYPDEWMSRYTEEKLHLVDPVVKYVLNHQSAVFWETFRKLEGYRSPEQIAFLDLAAEYGLVSGCSIPCNSYGYFAVFSIANKTSTKLSRLNESLPINHFYANQMLESVLKISVAPTGTIKKSDFSKREIECLYWGSEGKTAWEIAQILGISERTVVFHFSNATEKLNAANRQHAISKALLHGIVKPSV